MLAGYPAPPAIAVQIYSNGTIPLMIAKVTRGGMTQAAAIDWAAAELETYAR